MSGRILNAEQIDDLINYLDYDDKRRWKSTGDQLQLCCPVHGEKNPSAGISVSLQVFNCFACGVSGTFDYMLYRALPDEFRTISDATRFIRQRYKVDLSRFDENFRERIKRYDDFFIESSKDTRKIKPKYLIAPFMSGKETYQYFYDRGFSEETAETFMIGRDLDHETVTIPVFWQDKQLAGVIGRYLYPRSVNERYKVYDFERSKLLYPLDKFEPEEDMIILVEGMFDVMKLYQMGYRNGLSLMTNNMSEEQKSIIVNSCDKVVLMLDNDKRGQEAVKKITKELKGLVDVYHVDYPSYGKDPCDWKPKDIHIMLGTKRSHLKKYLVRL